MDGGAHPPVYSTRAAILGSAAISAWSVGAAAGVVLFNRLQPSSRTLAVHKQLPVFAAVFFAVTLLTPVADGFSAMCLVMFAIGMAGAPCDNLYYQISGSLAPEERQAEMFSWLNTATSVGVSAGAFLQGSPSKGRGSMPAFSLPALCSLASLILAAALAARIAATKKRPHRT